MTRTVEQLLNEIRAIFGTAYLSDLHVEYLDMNQTAAQKITAIPEELYPLEIWIKSAEYILGVPCPCQSIQEAKQRIIDLR